MAIPPPNKVFTPERVAKVADKIASQKTTPSNVSSGTWLMIVIGLGFIDAIQVVLDLFAVGVAANRFIDIAVGLFLGTFLWLTGQLGDPTTRNKIGMIVIATFVAEEIPVLDVAPFWFADGWYLWNESKKRNARAEQEQQEETDLKKKKSAYEQRQQIEELQMRVAERDRQQQDMDEQEEENVSRE